MKIERVVKTITLGKTVIVDDLEQREASESTWTTSMWMD